MSIVTKTGDRGETGVKGKRLAKDDVLVEVIGELDELMAVLAIVAFQVKGSEKICDTTSRHLYYISGYLTGYHKDLELKESVKLMEKDIEKMEKELPKIHEFLKAGGQLNIWLNWARVVARRVERRLVTLNKIKQIDENILIFINRLSDYLFILGRKTK